MEDEHGHGHSVASWTGVGVLLVGSTLLAVGIFFEWGWATWSGVGVCVLGVLAWVGLNAAGFGGPVSHASNTEETPESGAGTGVETDVAQDPAELRGGDGDDEGTGRHAADRTRR